MSKTIATQRRLLSDIIEGNQLNVQKFRKRFTEYAQKFRRIVIKSKILRGCSGSAEVEIGNTRVSCAISGPKESSETALEGILNITINGSSADQSIRYVLEHALRSVICLNKLARTELFIEMNVLADDGGVLSACLLAASVAIASCNIEMLDILLACQILILSQQLYEPPDLNDQHSRIILDPDQATISAYAGKGATLTISIIPSIGKIVCIEFGGGTPLPLNVIQHVLPLAFDYCNELYPIIRQAMLTKIDKGEESDGE